MLGRKKTFICEASTSDSEMKVKKTTNKSVLHRLSYKGETGIWIGLMRKFIKYQDPNVRKVKNLTAKRGQ